MELDNTKKLNDFFKREYHALRMYVNTKLSGTANRNAEDIIQDVALKLFAGADRYAPINNVAGFVYRSIKNRIIDVLRASKKTKAIALEDTIVEFSALLQQSANLYTSDKTVEILKTSIKKLKPPYMDIITAVDFEGYTYKEISNETGIPIGTLMSRRHRAIGQLYSIIENELKKTDQI